MAAEKIAAANKMNEILLFNYAHYGKEAVELLVKKQVDVVGGLRSVYDRIVQNFKRQLVDPFFVKEMWDLFEWRVEFFKEHFPQGSFVTEEDEIFANNDEDKDYLYSEIMTYQVTYDFAKLMILGSRENFESIVLLRREWWLSSETEYFYDRERVKQRFDDGSFQEIYFYTDILEIPYSILVEMALELYPKGPRTLEELAMKAVLKKDGSLNPDVDGKVLWKKSVQGQYTVDDDLPQHLSEKGRKLLKEMRIFSIMLKADTDGVRRELIYGHNRFINKYF